ncbi:MULTISPECIES: flagellar brake protein [Aminobacterium]|jgi:c-di-GMP-binding flagellar brake protein YcgR|uniref:flagellar brake protein n=1 Tax=Aminobacterium TaxID=81466 RepID=UPI00257BE5BD|nr:MULTISPECIES: flagellar brake protein [unclassified Aminobacterium]
MDFTQFSPMLKEHIGSKVLLDIRAGLYKGHYPSRLEDMRCPYLAVAHPMLKGALLPTHKNLELALSIEIDGALYETQASILRSSITDRVPLLWLEPMGDVIRLQRRRFVRVPCIFKLDLCFLDEIGHTVFSPQKWFSMMAKDISLGGCALRVNLTQRKFFEKGRRCLCRLSSADVVFLVFASVARVLEKTEDAEVGVSFEVLPLAAERSLGAFIRQQELTNR